MKMIDYVKKLFFASLCVLFFSCSNDVTSDEGTQPFESNILFVINTENNLSRAAVPQSFLNGNYYQLTLYKKSDESQSVKSKFQKTLSFTIPAPSWTGASVAKLDMYCPRTVDITTDGDGNVTGIRSGVCMTGSVNFNLVAGTRVFNHTIPLSFAGTENGSISLPVTVGTTGINSCIIVPDSAGNDSSKYIKTEVLSGNISSSDVSPFSDRVTFYFFEKAYSDLTESEPLENAKVIYSDSLTVFSNTTTDRWAGSDGTVKTVDLGALLYSTFVVASDGDDSKSGSSLFPLAKISTALTRCPQTGGTIYLKGNPKDVEKIIIDKSVSIEKLSGISGTPSIPDIEISDGSSPFAVTLKNVKISKTGATGISVGEKCNLVLDGVEVSSCNNGIVASKACSVNLKGLSLVKDCAEYGIKLDNANAELKLEGTSVDSTQAASSSLDVFAGSKIDLYCEGGKFVRLNTVCSDVSKSDDVLTEAITAIKDFGNGSFLLIGKSTDTSVTWSIKENGITINGGSSGSTYNIKPTNTAGRVVVERSLSASASAYFPLVKTSSANGTWKISSFTFRGGKNIGDSGSGGAFNISGGTFDFSSCRFESNNSGMGGAVYASGGTINFTSCTLGGGTTTGNSAEKNGGAIYATSTATINLLGTGNSISYNKSCTSTTISGNSAFGGGAIYLASGAKCEMEGGTIESNAVENIAVGTGAKTCGGSICVAGTSSFSLKGGTIKNGTVKSSAINRFGQDIYNEGTFRVSADSSALTISNTNSAGSIGEVYSTGNFYPLEGSTAFSGDNAVYDNISNGNGIARGVDFICIPTSAQGFIRINVPSKNNFYTAFSYMRNFSKGCSLFCGKSTDTKIEYDCEAQIESTSLDSTAQAATQSFEIKPSAPSTAKNKILIKSSLKLTGKGTFVLQDVVFSGTSQKISAECGSSSKLILKNTTVKNCGGIDVNDGVILAYEGNSLVGSHTVPITLKGTTSKINIESALSSTSNEDFDGYIGYVKLANYPAAGMTQSIFSGNQASTFAKYFYILPSSDNKLFELDNSNSVVQKTIDNLHPKTLMDCHALLPASPTAADYPQNGGTVACKTQKDLMIIADWVNNNKTQLQGVKIELKNHIVLNGEWTPIGKADGTYDNGTFRGVFDGKGYSISGLDAKYSSSNTHPALFQYLSSATGTNTLERNDGVVMNLVVKGRSECAGIVGKSLRGIIKDCTSEVVVDATGGSAGCAGGICGMNGGEINGCINKGNVTGISSVGGIAGTNYSGSAPTPIYYCKNTGAINGRTNVGGIVGNYSSRLLHCKNTGAVTATGENAGGIAGKFSGFNSTAKRGMYDCWNEGSVTAGNYAGGIIGHLEGLKGNTVYEVINILQASTSINTTAGNVKGCFYGKVDATVVMDNYGNTSPLQLKDGNLFYLNGINLTTSGVPADYYSASATSDTNCDGEENSSDDNQSSVSCSSSAFITKMNTWVSAANAKPWDSTYCPIPEWTSSW